MKSSLKGILVINKHRGISSAGVLTRIKHLFPKAHRPKLGHAGTLDPFATGVLLVLVGNATKLCSQLMGQQKRYLATIKLGATTATLDPTSEEIPDPTFDAPPDLEARVREVLPRFTGQIMQAPPAFSALRLRGRRAYELARVGKPVELEPRPVTIHAIDLVSLDFPLLQIDVRCGKGTYIRSLARDIAAALGTTGHLTHLIRTAVGPYSIDQAVDAEEVTAENIGHFLRSV